LLYDESNGRVVTAEEVLDCQAYLLVYSRLGGPSPATPSEAMVRYLEKSGMAAAIVAAEVSATIETHEGRVVWEWLRNPRG
jgi:hypothetical protein